MPLSFCRCLVSLSLVVAAPAWAQSAKNVRRTAYGTGDSRYASSSSIRGRQATSSSLQLVETNPVDTLQGFLNADMHFTQSRNLVVGPSVGFGNWGLGSIYKLGGFGDYYFDRNFHGWFARGEAAYYGINILGVKASAYQAGALGGYRWTWQTFTLALGLGMQALRLNLDVDGDVGLSSTGAYGLLRTGVVF